MKPNLALNNVATKDTAFKDVVTDSGVDNKT